MLFIFSRPLTLLPSHLALPVPSHSGLALALPPSFFGLGSSWILFDQLTHHSQLPWGSVGWLLSLGEPQPFVSPSLLERRVCTCRSANVPNHHFHNRAEGDHHGRFSHAARRLQGASQRRSQQAVAGQAASSTAFTILVNASAATRSRIHGKRRGCSPSCSGKRETTGDCHRCEPFGQSGIRDK